MVMALAAGGSRRHSTLVAAMCAVKAALYIAALLLPGTGSFLKLTIPDPGMIATAARASTVSIGAHALCGFSVRVGPSQRPSAG